MSKGTIYASLIVSCFAVAMLAGTSVVAYCAGRSIDTELRFLTPKRAPTPEEAATIYPIQYAIETSERNDVIFIGDSACRHDVDPALMPFSSYNLGMLGMCGPQALVITLEAYLAHHAAPRAVVLALTPYAISQGNDCEEGRGLGPRFARVYGREAGAITVDRAINSARRGACRLLPQGADIRDFAFADGRMVGETYDSRKKQLRESRGYWPVKGDHSKPFKLGWHGEPIEAIDDWRPALVLLRDLCRHAGCVLLVQITPMRSDMQKAKDWSPAVRLLRDSGIKINDPPLTFYDADLCWDHVHLNRAGVEKFNAAVAKDVQAALRDVR
jgi:hypothetical protein